MRTKLVSAVAIATLLFASCSNDDTPEPNDGRVKFTSGINQAGLRVGGVDGDRWFGNESIGIYMLEHGQSLSATSIKESADNVKYTYNFIQGDGKTVSLSPSGNIIYYPVNGPLVDFVAYHPYKDNSKLVNYVYPIDVTTQNPQTDIDLMMADVADNGGAGYDKTNTAAVDLNFKHQLAKVILTVKNGTGVGTADLRNVAIKVEGMYKTANFDLTGAAGISGWDNKGDITPYPAGANAYEFILLPVTLTSDHIMKFTIGNDTYTWAMTDNVTGASTAPITKFEGGQKYTFDVTLTKNITEVTGTIQAWGNGGSGTGTAN